MPDKFKDNKELNFWEEVGTPVDPDIDMHEYGRSRKGDNYEQVQNGRD